jgi:KDO2-lipid IV(A) lauroyltransferase
MARIGARSAGEMYRSLATGVFELLWLAGASKESRDAVLDRFVVLDPMPEGPVVLCASHTGNWELAAAAAARVRPLVVVAKPFSLSGFDAFVARLREALGIRVLRPEGALLAAREALAGGAVVVMPIDQVPERAAHATRASFLGEDAHVDRAPFVLARRSNAKIVVTAAVREGSHHQVRVIARLEPGRDTPHTATAALDAFVRANPAQWMWLHRRWRPPADRLNGGAWTTHSSSQAAASRAA